MARPTKLTDKFLKVLKDVINDDINAITYLDEDIIDEVNDRLEPDEQITQTTYTNWKNNQKNSEFFALVKKARRKQRNILLKQLRTEDKGWQRFAWILERKFTEFNLKQISEIQHKVEPITININI